MSTWTTVLLSCGLAYALKLAGYLVPERLLERPVVSRMVRLLPVALLLRAPLLVVVIAAAVTAAGLRAFGIG